MRTFAIILLFAVFFACVTALQALPIQRSNCFRSAPVRVRTMSGPKWIWASRNSRSPPWCRVISTSGRGMAIPTQRESRSRVFTIRSGARSSWSRFTGSRFPLSPKLSRPGTASPHAGATTASFVMRTGVNRRLDADNPSNGVLIPCLMTLTPGPERGEIYATLHGELHTILEWTERQAVGKAGKMTKPAVGTAGLSVSMVAGARNRCCRNVIKCLV